MAKEPDNKENEEVEKKSGSSTMKIVIVAVLFSVLLSGGLVGATFYFVSNMNASQSSVAKDADTEAAEDEDVESEKEPVKPPQYYSMDPKFVVSFRDQKSARFMQFSIDIMARDKHVIDNVTLHMPAIRSSLLLLFGNQVYEELVTREGKEKLLIAATADINNTLKSLVDEAEQQSVVEASYFNSFVIQ
jgi:flagellar FliL protein